MIRIPKGITIVGEIRCEGNIEVMGRIEGNSDIKGLLIITKECVWVGKAIADTIIIEGIVEGSVIARKKLEIAPSARISGSITAPAVLIIKGAELDCEVNMTQYNQTIDLNQHAKQKQLIIPEFKYRNDPSSVKVKEFA